MQRNPIFFLGNSATQANKYSPIFTITALLQAIYHQDTSESDAYALAIRHKNIILESSTQHTADYIVNVILTILTRLSAANKILYAETMSSFIKNGYHLEEIIKTFPDLAARYNFAVTHRDVIEDNKQATNVVRVLADEKKYEFAKDFCQNKLSSAFIADLLGSLKETDCYAFYSDYLRGKFEKIKFIDLVNLLSVLKVENFILVATELHPVVEIHPRNDLICKLYQLLVHKLYDLAIDPVEIYRVAKLYGASEDQFDMVEVIKNLKILNVSTTDLADYLASHKQHVIKTCYSLQNLIACANQYIGLDVATNLFLEYKNLVTTLEQVLVIINVLGYVDDPKGGLSTLIANNFNLDNLIQDGNALTQFLNMAHLHFRFIYATKYSSKIKTVDELISVGRSLHHVNRYNFVVSNSRVVTDREGLIKILGTMGDVNTKRDYLSRFPHLIDEAYENVADLNGLCHLAQCLAGTAVIDYKKIHPAVFKQFDCYHFMVRELSGDDVEQNKFMRHYKNAIKRPHEVIILMNYLPKEKHLDFLKMCKANIKTQQRIQLILNQFSREARLPIALIYSEHVALQDAAAICDLLCESDKPTFMSALRRRSASPTASIRFLFSETSSAAEPEVDADDSPVMGYGC